MDIAVFGLSYADAVTAACLANAGHSVVGVDLSPGKAEHINAGRSPVVELVERLLGKGHEIRIFDRNVNLSRLVGASRAYVDQHLPHTAKLMVEDVDEVVHHAGTIVIGNGDRYFSDVLARLNSSQRVVDLVRIDAEGTYNGICW